MENNRFGNWLKALRQQRRLSRRLVAERSGGRVSQQYLHLIETGKATNIGSEKVQALAEGLGVPLAVMEQALFQGVDHYAITGRTAAGGSVSPNADEFSDEIAYFPQDSQLFFVEIIGDSMAPRLEHGDWALIQPHQPGMAILNGGIYLLATGRRSTCKYVFQRPSDNPDNQQYWVGAARPELFETVPLALPYKILGRVVEVRKTQSLYGMLPEALQ